MKKAVVVIGCALAVISCSKKKTDIDLMDISEPQPRIESPAVEPLPVPDESPMRHFLNIQFDFDEYRLTEKSLLTLHDVHGYMLSFPADQILLEGHACEIGTDEYNIALGQRRADECKGWLVSAGIAAVRIETISYGEERPILEGCENIERCAINRRVEIKVAE
jgi:outer membrane protein OmpA-like peptidoglycan-associated protein